MCAVADELCLPNEQVASASFNNKFLPSASSVKQPRFCAKLFNLGLFIILR